MYKHFFGRKAAVSLLTLAQNTSDPEISAALVSKAVDLKDLAGELAPSKDIVGQPSRHGADRTIRDVDNLRLFVWIMWLATLMLLALAGTLVFKVLLKH